MTSSPQGGQRLRDRLPIIALHKFTKLRPTQAQEPPSSAPDKKDLNQLQKNFNQPPKIKTRTRVKNRFSNSFAIERKPAKLFYLLVCQLAI